MLFELMVEPAQAAKIAGARAATLVVRNRVVQVAPPDGLPASREPAGDVPRADPFLQPRRRPVTEAGLGVRATTISDGVGHGLLGRTGGCPRGDIKSQGENGW